MSFWPFCCKKPQVHPVDPDGLGLRDQFCAYYNQLPLERPPGGDSLSFAGSRSGRVVTNPLEFKSLCGSAGVTADGKLYIWGSSARAYEQSHARPVARESPSFSFRRNGEFSTSLISREEPEGYSGLFQVGSDTNWDSVADSQQGGRILATKLDGSLWSLGNWQSGVHCGWNGNEESFIKLQAFRAKLSASIVSIRTDYDPVVMAGGFGLPVWFTEEPQSAVIQKIRFRTRSSVLYLNGTTTVASSEPGSGAAVESSYRARIDDGGIRSISVTSGGAAGSFPEGITVALAISGHEDSGSGARAFAVIGQNGAIESVVVFDPGQGYKTPVTVSGGGGAFSVATPRRLLVTAGGSGYKTVPTVTIKPAPGEREDAGGATARVSKMTLCGVGEFQVLSGGSGYTSATATESRTGATATAVINPNGVITGWNLLSSGNAVYSPLDSDPLTVTITGDGEGATARAIPAGSSVEEIELVDNPETWTKKPLIEIEGDATAIVEGIIGRLEFDVTSGGSGYTKTSLNRSTAFANTSERSHYSPVVTVPDGSHVVGGRKVGGSVIAGEAVLSPSGVASIEENPAEFCNSFRSPYRKNDTDVTPEADSLLRHRMATARLNPGSEGVVHPFEQKFNLEYAPGDLGAISDQDAAEYLHDSIRAYLRLPGHARHSLQVEYVSKHPSLVNFLIYKITLSSPLASPQPPALCIERMAQPHRESLSGQSFGGSHPASTNENPLFCYGVDLAWEQKASVKAWWWSNLDTIIVMSVTTIEIGPQALYNAGVIVVTSSIGATHTYRIVDGRPVSENNQPVVSADPNLDLSQVTYQVSSPGEYLGPVSEQVLADPSPSWAPLSDPQRLHFVFPTEQGTPARGFAEATFNSSLQHPVIGSISLPEAGDGYTEEPDAKIFANSDIEPRNTGLTGCTSIGFYRGGPNQNFGDVALAVCQGSLRWWGDRAGIVVNAKPSSVRDSTPPDEDDGPADFYKWVLLDGMVRTGVGFAHLGAKPLPVGGHLRFSATGERVTAGEVNPLLKWSRLPRPDAGNRVASMSQVFARRNGTAVFENFIHFDADISLGSQSHQNHFDLTRRSPPLFNAADHGAGYQSSSTIEYVGPGLLPHTLSFTASIIQNDITRVSKSGLLRSSSVRWFEPRLRQIPEDSVNSDPRTITRTTPDATSCSPPTTTIAVTGGQLPQTASYAVVVRSAGQGESNIQWQTGNRKGLVAFANTDFPDANTTVATLGFNVGSPESDTFNLTATATTSYGGFREGDSRIYNYLTEPPTGSSNNGAAVEVLPFVRPRSPFEPFCYDELSETVDPAGILAADKDGKLRVVSSQEWLFEPEAFKDLPPVAGIDFARGTLRYPYTDGGTAQYIVRDSSGRLWGVAARNVSTFPASAFVLNPNEREPQVLVGLSPLAVATTDTGEGYDYPVKVEVAQPSHVAKGTVTIDGKIVSLAVIDGGSGYKSPPTISFGEAEISGPVSTVEVTSEGSGYRIPPKVRFSTPGVPAIATAAVQDGKVQSVSVSFGGQYRQAPQVFFDPDYDIESISLISGGQKYSTRPAVTIDGASATAEISASVARVTLVSSGSGYTTTPVVTITGGGGSGATAAAVLNPANGTIASINVTNGGSGYTTAPVVTISGGGGTGASGFSEIEGSVSSITLLSRGRGYDKAPQVIISGGGGTGATATATIAAVGGGAAATAEINGSVIAARVTQPGSGRQRPPVVTCSAPTGAGGSTARLKAAILGRPQSVTVTHPGSGYFNPFFSSSISPNAKRRTQSRHIRTPVVYAKGSFAAARRLGSQESNFYWGSSLVRNLAARVSSAFGNSLLSSFPWLGMAQLQNGDTDNGGTVSSVTMPQFVTSLQITNPGSGYTPFSIVDIYYSGTTGTLDNDSFRLLNRRRESGGLVARAHIGEDGKVSGISYVHPRSSMLGGVASYTSSPTFTLASGNATVQGVLGHPLECYYAPQVVFDGGIEADADVSLTLAGVGVEGSGSLSLAYRGAPSFPFVSQALLPNQLTRTSLVVAQGGSIVVTKRPDLRVGVFGSAAGLNRFGSLTSASEALRWSDEDLDLRKEIVGFFSTPPDLILEDEKGSGVQFTLAPLPASGAVTGEWVETCPVSNGGTGYTLGARLRLVGGRPLAWDNPATATASVANDGRVASLSLQQGGKGYTKPPLVYIVGDGTGATAAVGSINSDTGVIESARMVSRGSGYTQATVVFVDRETVADKSQDVARLCDLFDRRYGVVLEKCKIDRTTMPGELRKERSTLGTGDILARSDREPRWPTDVLPTVEYSFFGSAQEGVSFGGFASGALTGDLDMEAAGYRFHPAYESDGRVEYVRVEQHYGELPPTPTSVTIQPTSDVQPAKTATAIATIPHCGSVFSGAAASPAQDFDFPPYQFSDPEP